MKLYVILLIVLAVVGWVLAIALLWRQWRVKQKTTALQKRLEMYTAYLSEADQLFLQVKTDPRAIYTLTFDFIHEALSGGLEESQQAAQHFQLDIAAFILKINTPLNVLKQALGKLKPHSSKPISVKIDEIEYLIKDYANELNLITKSLSTSSDINNELQKLQTIGYERRVQWMESINREIQSLMGKEIEQQYGILYTQLKDIEPYWREQQPSGTQT